MITKKAEVVLTDGDVESPEDIEIVLTVRHKDESCDYTIIYPKESTC